MYKRTVDRKKKKETQSLQKIYASLCNEIVEKNAPLCNIDK